jgi:hypothetical protein
MGASAIPNIEELKNLKARRFAMAAAAARARLPEQQTYI